MARCAEAADISQEDLEKSSSRSSMSNLRGSFGSAGGGGYLLPATSPPPLPPPPSYYHGRIVKMEGGVGAGVGFPEADEEEEDEDEEEFDDAVEAIDDQG